MLIGGENLLTQDNLKHTYSSVKVIVTRHLGNQEGQFAVSLPY